jgi:hypothetical protein
MNPKIKKNVAKEVIYFFSIVLLTSFVWIGIKINNYYFENKIIKCRNLISNLKKEINGYLPKNSKYILINNIYSEEDFFTYAKTKKKSLNLNAGDAILTLGNEFNHIKEVELTYNKNKIQKLKILYKNLKLNFKKIDNYNKCFLNENFVVFNSFLFLLILIYPLRFVFILLKWSFSTIKTTT